MGINKKEFHKLLRYRIMIEIYKNQYKRGMTLISFWGQYIYPVMPCCYSTFRNALSESKVDEKIEKFKETIKKEKLLRNQPEIQFKDN